MGKRRTMELVEATTTLIRERIPLAYDSCLLGSDARKLARQFVAEDEWASSLEGKLEVEEIGALCDRVVPWVRTQGYPLNDGPCPPYGVVPRELLGQWRPR